MKIPTVSGLTAILVGFWVAATFQVSPIRAFLVRGRILRGSHHYVDRSTYRVLAIVLPLLVAAITAFFVQRYLQRRRELWRERDALVVSHRNPEVQTEVKRREAILDEAMRLGLITEAEHAVKRADLYASYARDRNSPLGRLIAQKLT